MLTTKHLELIRDLCQEMTDRMKEGHLVNKLNERKWVVRMITLAEIMKQIDDRNQFLEEMKKEDIQVYQMLESTFGIEIERY